MKTDGIFEYEPDQPIRETEPKGELVPPPTLPPAGVGTGTSGSEGGRRVIFVSEETTVGKLARLMRVPILRVIDVGLRDFGRLLTVGDRLDFELARNLAVVFGFDARPRHGRPRSNP